MDRVDVVGAKRMRGRGPTHGPRAAGRVPVAGAVRPPSRPVGDDARGSCGRVTMTGALDVRLGQCRDGRWPAWGGLRVWTAEVSTAHVQGGEKPLESCARMAWATGPAPSGPQDMEVGAGLAREAGMPPWWSRTVRPRLVTRPPHAVGANSLYTRLAAAVSGRPPAQDCGQAHQGVSRETSSCHPP